MHRFNVKKRKNECLVDRKSIAQPESYPTEMSITEIVNEFIEKVDTEKEYTLTDLKKLLTEAFKGHKSQEEKPKKERKPKEPKEPKEAKEEPEKKKRAPTAYNNYIKARVAELKEEKPEIPAKELLGMAASEWKTLSEEEKAKYKS